MKCALAVVAVSLGEKKKHIHVGKIRGRDNPNPTIKTRGFGISLPANRLFTNDTRTSWLVTDWPEPMNAS
jgi:hypothetical protein